MHKNGRFRVVAHMIGDILQLAQVTPVCDTRCRAQHEELALLTVTEEEDSSWATLEECVSPPV